MRRRQYLQERIEIAAETAYKELITHTLTQSGSTLQRYTASGMKFVGTRMRDGASAPSL